MAAFGRALRPLAGAVGIAPLVSWCHRTTACDDKPKPQFQTATCLKSEQHTQDTKKITLRIGAAWTEKPAVANVMVRAGGAAPESGCCACCTCPEPCACPKGPNGCCACCKCPDKCSCPKKAAPESSSVTRMYNPLSAQSGSEITLLVKKYADAKMGTALHNLKPGETVEVKGPNQQWTFKEGKYTDYAMVAGGTGITPLIQAAEYILKNGTAKVTFITFNKTPGDVLLRQELANYEKSYPGRFNVVHFVEGGEQDAGCRRAGRCCMQRHLKELLPSPADGVLVMVCGRPDMAAAVAGAKTKDFKQGEVAGILKELGYESKHVQKM